MSIWYFRTINVIKHTMFLNDILNNVNAWTYSEDEMESLNSFKQKNGKIKPEAAHLSST